MPLQIDYNLNSKALSSLLTVQYCKQVYVQALVCKYLIKRTSLLHPIKKCKIGSKHSSFLIKKEQTKSLETVIHLL